MTCCICNREGKGIVEYKSTLSKKTLAYCPECFISGYEPYSDLVDFGWEFELYTKYYQQKVILPTLNLNHKTVEQFNEDVKKREEELNASST